MAMPSHEELQKAWMELKKIHANHLQKEGVKIPSNSQFDQKNKSIWLALLYLNRHRQVHKDEISEVTQYYNPKAGRDQQVRHLKRDGWNIGDAQGLHQLKPYEPSAEWMTTSNRKRKLLNAKNFDEIKEAFDYCCATCGARERETSPKYGDAKIELQRGHRDPAGDGDDPENIIPQCQYCNRSYRDNFVFDDKGRVKAVASIQPVKKAHKVVQRKILTWLQDNLKSILLLIWK